MGRNIKSPLKPSGLEPGTEINIHRGGCHCAPAANGFRPGSIAKLKEETTLSAARRASRSRDSRSWVHVLSTAICEKWVSISSQVMLPIVADVHGSVRIRIELVIDRVVILRRNRSPSMIQSQRILPAGGSIARCRIGPQLSGGGQPAVFPLDSRAGIN